MPFPCQTEGFRSPTPPDNVNLLRPGDIDVIAAMGDSLTVGFGLVATNVLNIFVENRGLAWSGGKEFISSQRDVHFHFLTCMQLYQHLCVAGCIVYYYILVIMKVYLFFRWSRKLEKIHNTTKYIKRI